MSIKATFIGKEVNLPEPSEGIDRRNHIVKWGSDNLYPQFLNGLYYDSAINGGIINSKVHYTTSGGLNYTGPDAIKYDLFFNNGNSDFNLDEICEQASLDLEISNMFCLRGVWSLDKSRIDKVEVIDFEKVRFRSDSEAIEVKEDWSNPRCTAKIIQPFNPSDRSDREFYIIHKQQPKQTKKGRKLNVGIYPKPTYSGALTSILTDTKVTKYQLNEISNGFSAGTIINLNNGKPADPEQAEELREEIKDNATGEENAGRPVVLFNNGKDREATITNLTGNDLNDRYLSLSKDVRDNIVLSHSVTTPILFGVKTEGSLGNATELEIGYKIMNANYFKYRRRAITQVLNHLFEKGNQGQGEIEFNEITLGFEEAQAPKETQSKQINVGALFQERGKSREGQTVLFTRCLPNEFDVEEEKEKLMEEFQKENFRNLSATEYQVLNLIKEGNKYDAIRKALGVNVFKLVRIYNFLKNNKLITKNGEVTTDGVKTIARQDLSKVEIYYSYDINPKIGGPDIIPTTRDFCRSLVTMSETKVWSREDIDFISSKIGYNAFSYRGGWYHNPKTDINTPWCRHIWKQEIVYK
jgi:hypothetical protein